MAKTILVYVICGIFYQILSLNVAMAFWPSFHANYQRNGQTEEKGPLEPVLKWQFEGLGDYASAVVGKDGTVYAAGKDTLYAIQPTGKEKWRYHHPDSHFSPPSLGPDGTVYITTVTKDSKTHIVSLDPDKGKKKWQSIASQGFTAEYWVSHIAVSSDGMIYVAAADNLSAFAASGIKKWTFQFPANFGTVAPSLSPDEKTIYVYRRNRDGLYAFNIDGTLKWHDKSPYYSDFSSPTVASDGTIYLLDAAEQNLHAINPDGKKKWTTHFSNKHVGTSNVAIGKDGTLYMDIANSGSSNGGMIYGINQKDGGVKWKFEIKDGYIGTAIAVDGRGNLYYAAGDATIYCLKPDGALQWKYSVAKEHRFFYSSPAISNETIYAVTERTGILFAIGLSIQK